MDIRVFQSCSMSISTRITYFDSRRLDSIQEISDSRDSLNICIQNGPKELLNNFNLAF